LDTTIGDEDGSGPAEYSMWSDSEVFSGHYCNIGMSVTYSLDFR